MNKRTILAALCALVFSPVYGGTVSLFSINDLSQANDWALVDVSNTNLSTGYVAIGYFTTGFDVTTASFASLVSNFTVIDADADDVLLNGSQQFYGSMISGATGISADYGTPTAGELTKDLYIFIGNGAVLGSSTQFALLDSNFNVDADAPSDSNTLTFNQATAIYGSKFTSGGTLDTSSFPGGSANQPASRVQLVAVPEPSAALLGALGMVGLLRRRRKA
jgi:hypothetical protein